MFKHQPNALVAVFKLMEARKPLDPKKYARGQPAVVNAVFEYFNALLDGGEQCLELVGEDVVLAFERIDYTCKVTLYKGSRPTSFSVGLNNWGCSNNEEVRDTFFESTIRSMLDTMGFEKAIDASAQYKAQSKATPVKTAYAEKRIIKSAPNRKVPTITHRRRKLTAQV